MQTMVLEKEKSHLALTPELIDIIYDYTWKTVEYSFKSVVDMLKTRNGCYEREDFVQEVVELIIKDFKTKTFESIPKLKSYIRKTISFHYLKEKRKYFQTKQRGNVFCTYINDLTKHTDSTETKDPTDSLPSRHIITDDASYLHNLLSKNLLVHCDWRTFTVCRPSELRQFKDGVVLSVNHFIVKQRDLGKRDTCKYYKEQGFYMTRQVFESISQAIIDYAREHELIVL